jgi:RNA polymerase sigma factor (sigma-70 family)
LPKNKKSPYPEANLAGTSSNRETTEIEMIEAFIAGDIEAFKYVYNKYRERIFSYCLYVTGNKTQAEDSFQEVFIRIYQRREQLREAKALKNWLLQIARSVCLNLTRESVFTPDFIYLDDDMAVYERFRDPRELAHDAQNAGIAEEIFQVAFNQIAPMYRDAFLLREIEGFSCEEIAELTGTSTANVKVRIMRAKKMLRAILSPHFKHRLKKIEQIDSQRQTENESSNISEENSVNEIIGIR